MSQPKAKHPNVCRRCGRCAVNFPDCGDYWHCPYCNSVTYEWVGKVAEAEQRLAAFDAYCAERAIAHELADVEALEEEPERPLRTNPYQAQVDAAAAQNYGLAKPGTDVT